MHHNVVFRVSMVLLLFINCKEESKQERSTNLKELVNHVQSPTASHSSLPYLFSNGNKTLLSWVEKEGDSLTKFKYAKWDAEKWQEPQESVAESRLWDFPLLSNSTYIDPL